MSVKLRRSGHCGFNRSKPSGLDYMMFCVSTRLVNLYLCLCTSAAALNITIVSNACSVPQNC